MHKLVSCIAFLPACQGWTPCDTHRCPAQYRLSEDSFNLSEPGAIVRSVRHGRIDCLEPGAHRTEPGKTDKLAFCEGSAVVFDGRALVVASDKPVPGRASSVFEVPFSGTNPGRTASRYLGYPAFMTGRKFEDATLTPDGLRVFLSTGFDRVKADRDSWDGYNLLLTYPVGAPHRAQVVGLDDGDRATSVELRRVLQKHLPTLEFPDGAPYFKIEAVAAAPGQRLIFGVRELGATYQTFDYSMILIEASWRQSASGRVVLKESSFRTIYRRDDFVIEGHRVGVSSLEYDPHRRAYHVLASYEYEPDGRSAANKGALGGFLFSLSPQDIELGSPPKPVVGPRGRILHFLNKPEGVTVVGPGRLLVLFDDDRVLECEKEGHWHRRSPHQTPFAFVELIPDRRTELASSRR